MTIDHKQICIDMLAFHGIDSKNVAEAGICAEGYNRYVENGEKLDLTKMHFRTDNPSLVIFETWPINFPVASFFEHYWAWKGAVV